LVGYDQNINTGLKFNQITEHDDENALRVVTIDTEAAHQVWPDQNSASAEIGKSGSGSMKAV
jgi:hypothetical protein